MATKVTKLVPKTSKPGTAVAVKKTGGAIVNIQEALRAQVASLNERTAPASGVNIRLGGKKFQLPDGTKSEGPMQFVVLDFVARNEFYEGDFDKDNITPPACFAIGTNPLKLVPSQNSPQIQADTCGECPNNEFGSKGKGKACNNTRVLAVLPPDGDDDTPIFVLKVSATGTKNFDAFVQSTSRTYQVPPVGVVVTVSFDENEDYPKLVFSDAEPNPNLAAHFARQGEARDLINREPDVSGFAAATKKPPAKKAAGGRR